MVSVIDKPGLQESTWWRGKKKFEVHYLLLVFKYSALSISRLHSHEIP